MGLFNDTWRKVRRTFLGLTLIPSTVRDRFLSKESDQCGGHQLDGR